MKQDRVITGKAPGWAARASNCGHVNPPSNYAQNPPVFLVRATGNTSIKSVCSAGNRCVTKNFGGDTNQAITQAIRECRMSSHGGTRCASPHVSCSLQIFCDTDSCMGIVPYLQHPVPQAIAHTKRHPVPHVSACA